MKQLLGLISYRQKRVMRSLVFPAVLILTLLLGIMLCRGFVVFGSGISLISSVQAYVPLLGLMLFLAAAALVGREEDEGGDVFLLAAPLSSPVILLVKIFSLWPLTAAVFLGLFIPVMVELSVAWWKAGYAFSLMLAETGIFLLWLLPSLLFVTVLGGVLGMMKRGFLLYLMVLFTWGVLFIGVEVLPLTGWLVPPRSSLWPLLGWHAMAIEVGLSHPIDLWSFLPGLPVWARQRSFYIAVTTVLTFCAAMLFRRRRRGHKEVSFSLPAAAVFALVIASILGTGFYFARENIAASARAEAAHYISFAREHPEHFQIAHENQFIRVNSYDLHLDISEPPLLAVRALLAVENLGTEEVSPLHLNLRHHFRVSEARVGDDLITVEQVGDRVIFPGTVLAPGESIEIALEYAGAVEEWRLRSGDPVIYLKHFVKDYGLYLPPAYGWYPIASALPLTVVKEAWPGSPYKMRMDELDEVPLSLADPLANRNYIDHIISMLPAAWDGEDEEIALDEWEIPRWASHLEEGLKEKGIGDGERKSMIEEELKALIREGKRRMQQKEILAGLLPWREETFFRVTVEPLPQYTLVSNLAERRYIQGEGIDTITCIEIEAYTETGTDAATSSAVLFEGYASYLFLLGWPLERIAVDGGEVYASGATDMAAAAELIEEIQFMRDWFGAPREEVRLISFPMRGQIGQVTINGGGRFYVESFLRSLDGWRGESIMLKIAANLLCGVRMPNSAESRLIEAFIEARRRLYREEYPERMQVQMLHPRPMPWVGLDKIESRMPQAVAIVDWLEENEGAAENPVHALFLLSRERPLREDDLAVFAP